MSTELKHKILSGVFWQGLERFGSQLFQLVLQIILARLLLPSDFGAVVLLAIFVQVAMVFIDSGLGAALVQQKTLSKQDLTGVFWVNIPVAALFYAAIYVLAPYVERFYQISGLGDMLRVIALCLFFYAFTNVPLAIAQREMVFHKLFLINFPGTIGSGIIGIVMALRGYGAWSLVWMQLSGAFFRMVLAYSLIHWLPGWRIQWRSLMKMLNFSYKLLLTALIDVLFSNLYSLAIGKFFSTAQLGYYSKACKLPQFAMTGVQGTIGSVIFPALSSCQHDLARMREIVRKSIVVSSFVMIPVMLWMIACAKPLILVLLGDNWQPAISYLRWTPLIFIFWPLHVANLQATVAAGRSDLMLKLEIYKKIMIVVTMAISIYWGVEGILIGQVICSFAAFIVNAHPVKKMIDYSAWQQLKDTYLSWLCGGIMAVVVYGMTFLISPLLLLLACQVLVGVVCYCTISWLLNRKDCRYMLEMLQTMVWSKIMAKISVVRNF